MPRHILIQGRRSESRADSVLSLTPMAEEKQETQTVDRLKLDRVLRRRRSKAYLDAIAKLDAGGHTTNRRQVEEIVSTIRNEFPEIEIGGVLLGIVATCYLGAPYEVHTLSLAGGIIEHYESGRALPGQLEKARSLARRGGYAFIEVYVGCCRAVSSDGLVSVVPD